MQKSAIFFCDGNGNSVSIGGGGSFGVGGRCREGNGVLEEQDRQVGEFQGIFLSGIAEVQFEPSEKAFVRVVPDRKSSSGTRYYDADRLLNLGDGDTPTVGYARVSSHDQAEDLVRQAELLETFCAAKGWRHEIITDLGSGMNYRKKGLHKLLDMILNRQIKRLVITHKDRLLRFGAELVFALCEIQGIEVVIINKGETPSFEEELTKDVLEIITVFSARLCGSRSHKSKKLIDDLNKAAAPHV